MKRLTLAAASLFISYIASAQTDTTYKYFSKEKLEVSKDSAHSVLKLYKQTDLWRGVESDLKTNIVRSEGNFADSKGQVPVGLFNNYNDKAVLDNAAEFSKDGKITSRTYYYRSGKKKSTVTFDRDGKVDRQIGWDEDGKEIKNFTVMKDPSFKGGTSGWMKYVAKNVNGELLADLGIPAGTYNLKIYFVIDKDGSVTQVRATSSPACRQCVHEAVSAISASPGWSPAILNNEPVKAYQMQPLTLNIVEGKQKKNR
jgi:antitoxin component YwqK of YwqJK toxin-antitoxin module